MNLVIMSIEERACDGVSGDFTVYLWDNDEDVHYPVHCTYLVSGSSVVPQDIGLPWPVISFISGNLALRADLREAVLAERDGLEQDAKDAETRRKKLARGTPPPRWNVN